MPRYPMMNRKQFEYEIVRAAEREPKRTAKDRGWASDGQNCLVATAIINFTGHKKATARFLENYAVRMDKQHEMYDGEVESIEGRFYHKSIFLSPARSITNKIIDMNDMGMAWGKIVKELKLVPGEWKIRKPKAKKPTTKIKETADAAV